jgi:hypothetical protein
MGTRGGARGTAAVPRVPPPVRATAGVRAGGAGRGPRRHVLGGGSLGLRGDGGGGGEGRGRLVARRRQGWRRIRRGAVARLRRGVTWRRGGLHLGRHAGGVEGLDWEWGFLSLWLMLATGESEPFFFRDQVLRKRFSATGELWKAKLLHPLLVVLLQ